MDLCRKEEEWTREWAVRAFLEKMEEHDAKGMRVISGQLKERSAWSWRMMTIILRGLRP